MSLAGPHRPKSGYRHVCPITRGTKVSMMQLDYSKVAQPKHGAFRLQVCLCWTMPTRVKANSKLMISALTPGHLCRGVKLPQRMSWIWPSDGEVSVILKHWGMQSNASLTLFPSPFWSGVLATDRVLSMGQIELNCVLMLNWTVWNRTVYKY